MGMRLDVIGLRDDKDPHYIKMLAAKKALDAIQAQYPHMVSDYFKGTITDDEPLRVSIPVKDYESGFESGYELEVDKIPAGVKRIRFVATY